MIIPDSFFGLNPCHEVSYCCDNFNADMITCTNTVECDPQVLDADLRADDMFLIQWLSPIGFILLEVFIYAYLLASERDIGNIIIVQASSYY